jgi:hypothetical protein
MTTRESAFGALLLYAIVLLVDFLPLSESTSLLVKLLAGLGVISFIARAILLSTPSER